MSINTLNQSFSSADTVVETTVLTNSSVPRRFNPSIHIATTAEEQEELLAYSLARAQMEVRKEVFGKI